MFWFHVEKYHEIALDLHHVIMLTLHNFSILNNVHILHEIQLNRSRFLKHALMTKGVHNIVKYEIQGEIIIQRTTYVARVHLKIYPVGYNN
jgi:hypothetical protein